MDEKVINQGHGEMMTEVNSKLSDILMADFMMHLATTTLMMVLKDAIIRAKTPEEIEGFKNIPDQIVTGWAESRKAQLTNPEEYLKLLSENKNAPKLSQEDLALIVSNVTGDEKKVIELLVANLRKGFAMLKAAL